MKGEPGDGESESELVSPSEEEIGDEGHRGVRVGLEPLDDWGLEFGECGDEGVVSGVAEFTDVFCTGGDVGVGGERKCEGLDCGWVGREERVEEWEVFGSDDDCDG